MGIFRKLKFLTQTPKVSLPLPIIVAPPPQASYMIEALFVSLPVMCGRQISYYVVGCPCLLLDGSKQDDSDRRLAACCERVSTVATDLIGALGMVMLLVAAGIWIKNPPESEEEHSSFWWEVVVYFPQTWSVGRRRCNSRYDCGLRAPDAGVALLQ